MNIKAHNMRSFIGIKAGRLIIGRYRGLWAEYNNTLGFYVSMSKYQLLKPLS